MPNVDTLQYVGTGYPTEISFQDDASIVQLVPGTPTDQFAAVITCQQSVRSAGTYTFCTTSEDGSDLSIDGALVVDNQGIHPSQKVCANKELTSGFHIIKINFFDQTSSGKLEAAVLGPDTGHRWVALQASQGPGEFDTSCAQYGSCQ